MKRLSQDLKRMLNALAHQNMGDFLPMRDKLDALGVRRGEVTETVRPSAPRTATRRVAMLSDGGDSSKVLRFALDACKRQQASLDLVLYGEAARKQAEEVRAILHHSEIAHEIIVLGEQSVEALSEYLHARRTLTYLVAAADDLLALQLTEEVAPRRGGRLHLPLVMIDRGRTPHHHTNRINVA